MLRPVRDNLIVDPYYDPEKVETGLSPGAPGLYMPDSAKNPMSQQGIVVAVGPLNKDIEEGDHVLYHPFVANPFRQNGYEYLSVEYRFLVGWLDDTGDLWPLPTDVVIRPHFQPAGRPVRQGSLWVPRQVFDTDIPCTGTVIKVGDRAGVEVQPGQIVLYPPNRGNEIGLKKVYYTIKGRDLLATLEREVDARIEVTPAWWQLPAQEVYSAGHPNQ